MQTLRLMLAAAMLCCPTLAASAQQAAQPPALLKAADLQADLAILRSAYEQLHPGLYRYNTRAQMDAHLAALARQLDHDQSLQEAYLAFSVLGAEIKCGHTYANFFNQPKDVAQVLFRGQTRVPYYFVWLDRRMIVTRDFTPMQKLPRGTEVLSINDVPASAILARLMTIARADGGNNAKRVALLQVTGDDKYETFDIFFPFFFPQHSPRMNLLVKRPGAARPQAITVEALTYEQRIASLKRADVPADSTDGPFTWKYLADGNAYLGMPDWTLYNSKWDWKAWLNKHMDELAEKNPPALIIDLRGNEGGNDVGNVVLAHLIDHDLPLTSLRRLVRYRKVPEPLAPYLDTWDPSFKDWGAQAVDMPQPWPTTPPGKYLLLKRFDDDPSGDRIQPEGKRYAGKVYVLVDANNSSATFQFAQIVQQHKLGVLVGQPTGGNQRGINGGAFFFLRLPHSHIEMDLPLIGTFPQKPMPDAGLTPDILVKPTQQDIAEGRDAVLERLQSLQSAAK